MLTEILIHISAPSRVQDDRRYRSQAQGYLDFRAARRHDLSPNINASPGGRQAEGISTILPATATTDNATTTDGSSSSSSANGAEDDRSSQNLMDPTAEIVFNSRTFSRLDLTPAQSRSYLSALAANGNSRTPTVYVERTPIDRPRTAPTTASPSVAVNQHQRPHSDSWQTPPSVVPDSQPSRNSLKRNLPISSSFSSSTQSVSPLTKRQRFQPGDQPSSSNPPSSPGSALPHESALSQKEHCASQNETIPPPSSYLAPQRPIAQIHPPAPPTSIAPFNTHITPSLTYIVSSLPLERHFRPSHTTRAIRSLERGYWQLSIDNTWSSELRAKFWTFLQSFIGEGKAGWGVWCERYADISKKANAEENPEDLPAETGEKTRDESGEKHASSGGNELVRLYCWGETVPYIYLALFIATSRKIKEVGAAWIDASGEEVIRMV